MRPAPRDLDLAVALALSEAQNVLTDLRAARAEVARLAVDQAAVRKLVDAELGRANLRKLEGVNR